MRNWMKFALTAAVPALLAGSAFAFHDDDEGDRTSAPLVRPDPAPDSDASGEICERRRLRGESVQEKLKFKVRHVTKGLSFDLWMAGELGEMQFVATFGSNDDDGSGDDGSGDEGSGDEGSEGDGEGGGEPSAFDGGDEGDGDDEGSGDEGEDGEGDEGEDDGSGDDGENDEGGELEMTFEHGALPLEAASLLDLVGRRVEVRVGEVVYLFGEMPAFDGQGSSGRERTEIALSRPEEAPDEDARGEAKLDEQESKNRSRFRVEVRGLPEQDYFLDVEGEEGESEEGPALESKGHGRYRLRLDTKHGDALPLDLLDADDMEGRRIEIRGEDGDVYLVGTLGDLAKKAKSSKSSGRFGEGGSVRVRMASQPRVPNQSFELRARGLDGVSDVVVLVEDPDGGEMVEVAELVVRHGSARLRLRTKDGDALPLGVADVKDLAGLAVELRDAESDELLAEGMLPGM